MKTDCETLILSSPTDVHATVVAHHLTELGVPFKIWRVDDFLQSCSLSFAWESGDMSAKLRMADDTVLDLNRVGSIWFRRPGASRSMRMPEPWIEKIMELESNSALGGIFRSLPALMVNHPGRDAECLYKIWQLRAARSIGLEVPESIVTNEPDEARKFIENHNRKVIYKFVGENCNLNLPRAEMAIGIPTMKFRDIDFPHLEQVRFGPHLFQGYVEKQFEVRVTAIGKRLFPGKIESQTEASSGKIDWRMDYTVPMTPFELPDDIAEKCLKLLKLLGLNYGAIDFIVDTDGRYVFLECNCAGQFVWLEDRTGMPLALEMAKLLAGRGEPIVPGFPASTMAT